MFVHPKHCRNKLSCRGIKSINGRNHGRAPVYFHVGHPVATEGVCAYCALAAAPKKGAFLTVEGQENIMNENSSAFIETLTPESLYRIFGSGSVDGRPVYERHAKWRRSNFKVISGDEETLAIDAVKGGSDLMATPFEMKVHDSNIRQSEEFTEEARKYYAEQSLRNVVLEKPFEDCKTIYKDSFVRMVVSANEFSQSHAASSDEQINSDALAYIIAAAITSGRNVFITNDLLPEEKSFKAIKKANQILGSKILIAKNKTKKAVDYYLCDETGLQLGVRWNRQGASQDSLTLKVARMSSDESIDRVAVSVLRDDRDHKGTVSGKSGKLVRFIFSGIRSSEIPDDVDAVILSKESIKTDALFQKIASGPAFEKKTHGEDAAKIAQFCAEKNPVNKANLSATPKKAGSSLDQLRSKIMTADVRRMNETQFDEELKRISDMTAHLVSSWGDRPKSTRTEADLFFGLARLISSFLNRQMRAGHTMDAIHAISNRWPSMAAEMSRQSLSPETRTIFDFASTKIMTALMEEKADLEGCL
jgi:hypothetical protein